MTERITWLISSVFGIAVAAVYMALVWAQIQTAQRSRFSLQLPQLWGQLASGGLLALRFVLMAMLGIMAIAESPAASLWGVRILIAGNILAVLAIVVLIVALNWTVHQDDEENATVAEEIETGEVRAPTMATMSVSKDNPLPVQVIEPPEVVEEVDPPPKEA